MAHKREQATKVAETDPFMAAILHETSVQKDAMAATLRAPFQGPTASPVNLNLDHTVSTTLTTYMYIFLTPAKFSTRSVRSLHTTNLATHPAMLMASLTVHQGRVPPAIGAVGTANRQTAFVNSQVNVNTKVSLSCCCTTQTFTLLTCD